MNKNIQTPFTDEVLLEDLPAERSYSEISGKYAELLSECMREYREANAARRGLGGKIADLTISLARNLKDGFENVAKWVDSVIPEFDFTGVPNYTYSTRAVGDGRSDEAPTKLAFEKQGNGCSMMLDMEVTPSGANLKVKLLDENGHDILPFSLSVRDETGTLLLQNREFRTGAANIKGIERGRYDLSAVAGSRTCEFTVAVE